MNTLSICSEMVYLDLPLAERAARIREKGFGVEIWAHTFPEYDEIASWGIPIESMQGYVHGNLAFAEDADEMVATAAQVIPYAKKLGCTTLVIHGAELVNGQAAKPIDVVTPAMWLNAYKTLERFAALGAEADVTFCLENLNLRVDHPGVPFATAADTLALVSAIDSPHVKMMLDLYHAQQDTGHLVDTVREAGRHIGEIQVADVPGRCEPGTGEVNYQAVAAAANEIGYAGTIGMEAYASGDSDVALDRFREAFTL